MIANEIPGWAVASRSTVARWCARPASWTGSRRWFRSPPRLITGDPAAILLAAGIRHPDKCSRSSRRGQAESVLWPLVGRMDAALYLMEHPPGCPMDAIEAAYEQNLDEFYLKLRMVLHPVRTRVERVLFRDPRHRRPAPREQVMQEPGTREEAA